VNVESGFAGSGTMGGYNTDEPGLPE
jgi:hypothetical protein